MITINFPFPPVAKGRPRFGKFGPYTPKKTRAYENEIKLWVSKHAPKKPLEGPLKVTVYFFVKVPKKPQHEYPITRPDVDNYLKGLLDALNGLVWRDDAQIVEVHCLKIYAVHKPTGAITMVVEEL